jgi:hypothetical protein
MLRPVIEDSDDKQRTITRLKELARALLAAHWTYVERVAARLAKRKTLSGTEVKRMVPSKS